MRYLLLSSPTYHLPHTVVACSSIDLHVGHLLRMNAPAWSMLDVDVSRYRDLREKFTPFFCVLHVTKHVCMVSDVVHYVVTRISALSDVTQ